MKVAIPKETLPGETRVAVIPETVKKLVEKGMEVTIETGAGGGASLSDDDYKAAGAQMESSHQKVLGGGDLILKIAPPIGKEGKGEDEVAMMPDGGALITFLQPFSSSEILNQLAARNITAISMEMVPRITLAQNMDALSSMATVAGYKAVLLAANNFKKFFPMFMTAAGTIRPAHTLVLGAGVAGLQAIATAKRLGAVVEAFDTRPVVKEQVESLGARFVALDVDQEDAQDAGGYAKEISEEHHKKELELIAGRLPKTDIIITTAMIPGKKAPILITEEMMGKLKPGSVIVDLAAETGGNCELTQPGEIVTVNEITIIGLVNLPSLMPAHASQMYSKNIANLVFHMMGEDGLKMDFEDTITAGVVVTHQGQIVHPALKGN